MKVRKELLHKDLQHLYFLWSLMPRFLRFRPIVKLVNLLTNRFGRSDGIEGLDCSEKFIGSSDGETRIRVRIYRPEHHEGPLPLLLYIHGGGYLIGNPDLFEGFIKKIIETRPCVVIAPDYRKAFTKPFPAALDDCYDTLLWAIQNTAYLGAMADKVIVAGHSAGGGLTAAVTLKARDTRDVSIAFQMPIYPMIDDLQPSDPERSIDSPAWNTSMNRFGWNAYLADLHDRGEQIPAYAAPARNSDYRNLPPTITFVGDLEPFYWETEAYVNGLREAEVDVAYRLYEGCFHGFDVVGEKTPIGREAINFTFRSYGEFYDRYILEV